MKKRLKKNNKKIRLLIFFTGLILLVIFGLYQLDKKALPMLLETSIMNANNDINIFIEESIKEHTSGKGYKSGDFYEKSIDGNGMINSISVDSLLVNEICSQIARDLSQKLKNMPESTVTIPLGTIFDINVFSNSGPMISFEYMPKGLVVVDYETKFVSEGINQINFQIWLNVSAKVRIINPFTDREMDFSRKVLLISTVYAGQVPDSFFNYQNK